MHTKTIIKKKKFVVCFLLLLLLLSVVALFEHTFSDFRQRSILCKIRKCANSQIHNNSCRVCDDDQVYRLAAAASWYLMCTLYNVHMSVCDKVLREREKP